VSISVIQACIFYLTQAKGTQVTQDIIQVILQKFELIEGKYEDVSSALNSSHSYIEDSIYYHMALRNQMDAILTSDKDFLKLSKPFLPVITPDELKKRIEF
jgi:predicted nucleic acid-binding protein